MPWEIIHNEDGLLHKFVLALFIENEYIDENVNVYSNKVDKFWGWMYNALHVKNASFGGLTYE